MKNMTRISGTKIGDVLTAQGRRQDWLAERVGVSPAAVNRWVKGSRTVDIETARRIAEILDVPLFLVTNEPIGTHKEPTGSEKAA